MASISAITSGSFEIECSIVPTAILTNARIGGSFGFSISTASYDFGFENFGCTSGGDTLEGGYLDGSFSVQLINAPNGNQVMGQLNLNITTEDFVFTRLSFNAPLGEAYPNGSPVPDNVTTFPFGADSFTTSDLIFGFNNSTKTLFGTSRTDGVGVVFDVQSSITDVAEIPLPDTSITLLSALILAKLMLRKTKRQDNQKALE